MYQGLNTQEQISLLKSYIFLVITRRLKQCDKNDSIRANFDISCRSIFFLNNKNRLIFTKIYRHD